MLVSLSSLADNPRGPPYMEQALAALHQANAARLPTILEYGERTTHVPLFVSVPGGVKGKSDKPVELLSIYPTLIDLCGLPANPRLEGVSLTPLLEKPNAA